MKEGGKKREREYKRGGRGQEPGFSQGEVWSYLVGSRKQDLLG